MTIKKQIIMLSVVYNEEDTYANSAAEAISHSLHNEEGILEWDFHVKSEFTLSAELTDADLDDNDIPEQFIFHDSSENDFSYTAKKDGDYYIVEWEVDGKKFQDMQHIHNVEICLREGIWVIHKKELI